MATLDVSIVLKNPKFLTEVIIQRPTVTVGSDGIGTRVFETYTCQACIRPLEAYEMERLPEGELLKGGIKVYSIFQFCAGDTDESADILKPTNYKGQQAYYTVLKVENWSMYGEGYTMAYCRLLQTRGGGSYVQY